jgi:hypothetical protein
VFLEQFDVVERRMTRTPFEDGHLLGDGLAQMAGAAGGDALPAHGRPRPGVRAHRARDVGELCPGSEYPIVTRAQECRPDALTQEGTPECRFTRIRGAGIDRAWRMGYDRVGMTSRIASERIPFESRSVRVLAIDAWRRAEAMGLVEPDVAQVDAADVVGLVKRVREAGIARDPALRLDNVQAPSADEAQALLRLVIDALEASPVPKFEWAAVSRVLDPEQLAALLNISVSSLRRYVSAERDTPDEVAARLHHLALIVGDLAGAYNEVGVRRWFNRRRTALDGRSPATLLAGDWNPDDPAPQKVRDLARSLVSLSTT